MSKLLALIIIIQSRGGQLRNFGLSVKFVNLRNVQANKFYLNTFRKIYVKPMPTDKIGEHITDIYITETGTIELENLSHNIIDIFIIETYHN